MVGCAVMLVLLLIGCVLFLFKATDLFGWALTQMEQQVLTALPDDLDAATRRQLVDAFDAVAEAVDEGRAEPQSLQELQSELYQISQSAGDGLTRQQVLDLIDVLERAAGIRDREESGSELVPDRMPTRIQADVLRPSAVSIFGAWSKIRPTVFPPFGART